jgi:hypothetical protein
MTDECTACGGDKKCIQNLVGKPERHHSKDGGIILY